MSPFRGNYFYSKYRDICRIEDYINYMDLRSSYLSDTFLFSNTEAILHLIKPWFFHPDFFIHSYISIIVCKRIRNNRSKVERMFSSYKIQDGVVNNSLFEEIKNIIKMISDDISQVNDYINTRISVSETQAAI